MPQTDLTKYQNFVEEITSQTSKDFTTFINRLKELDAYWNSTTQTKGPIINVPLLLTAAMGMGSESGEFQEIVKKIFFQGKELTDDAVFHMKRELGDIIFYWMDACVSLGLNPEEVIAENVRKLESRYPGGKFDVTFSENRKPGDL